MAHALLEERGLELARWRAQATDLAAKLLQQERATADAQ